MPGGSTTREHARRGIVSRRAVESSSSRFGLEGRVALGTAMALLCVALSACGAAVGILVTMPGALPKDWPAGAYFALYEDVWVTQASNRCAGSGSALAWSQAKRCPIDSW